MSLHPGLSAASVKAAARRLGFDLCGIAPAISPPELASYQEWLARGYAGSMLYLARSVAERCDVRQLAPWARAVVVTGTVYNTARPYSVECADPERADVSRYAWGDDYHTVIGGRLDALAAWMRDSGSTAGERVEVRAYVDTGPIHERAFARLAGLGWIGKHTLLINPALGSWLFLGVVVCSVELEPDAPGVPGFDQCGTCTLCLEACPTQAFPQPGVLDATRCLSYLTIEHRGPIPDDCHAPMGQHVYGCDVCQEVCPWNAHPPVSDDPAWQPRPAWDRPRTVDLEAMSDAALRDALRGSALKRTKLEGLRRNIDVVRRNRLVGRRRAGGGTS